QQEVLVAEAMDAFVFLVVEEAAVRRLLPDPETDPGEADQPEEQRSEELVVANPGPHGPASGGLEAEASLDRVVAVEVDLEAVLLQVDLVVVRLPDVRGRAWDRGEDRVVQRRRLAGC